MNNRLMHMTVDLSAIRQNWKKHVWNIVFVSLIMGCLGFLACDLLLKKTYSVQITFSITSENKNIMTNSYQVRIARQRMGAYLTSSTVKAALCEKLGINQEEEDFPAELTAEGLLDSNLIQVECKAHSREDALRAARVLRNYAPEIVGRLAKTFHLRPMGTEDAGKIQRTSRSPVQIAVLLGLLVFFAGSFLAIIEQIFSGKLQNRAQAERELDVKLIGSIPHENRKQKTQSMLINSQLRSLDYAEAFQRTALSVMRQMNASGKQILLITSALENEGKSTTAANLALAMVRNGKRVLLVDSDLRKPALHKIFEKAEYPDFGDYLRGKLSAEEAAVEMPQKGLCCCFSNPVEEEADFLLEQKQFACFLQQMKEQVDYILIDTSPAASTRDAAVLGGQADGILLVARMNMAAINLINDTAEELELNQGEVMGVLLNDCREADVSHGRYRYGYRYRGKYDGKYGYFGTR